MLSSVARYFSQPIVARAYNTLTSTMRTRVARGPTRAVDHSAGRGTAAFNEREQAMENKAVKDHEANLLKKLREDAKAPKETVEKPKAKRSSGLKTAGSSASASEVEAIQKQIDQLQAQLNKIKK